MEKRVGQAGINLIKEFEGCRLTAYKCPAGVWTIGYGHTAGVKRGMTITQAQADKYLVEDCQKFADYVDNKAYVPFTNQLNSNQRDALISFAYNCGPGSLKTLCEKRDISQVAAALLLYNKANGQVLAGLVRRRQAERDLFNKAVKSSSSSTSKKETEAYNMDTIQKGSKGKAVMIWQIIVGVTPDGDFGGKTEKATEKFQKKKKLTVDGVVGPKSWEAGFNSI